MKIMHPHGHRFASDPAVRNAASVKTLVPLNATATVCMTHICSLEWHHISRRVVQQPSTQAPMVHRPPVRPTTQSCNVVLSPAGAVSATAAVSSVNKQTLAPLSLTLY